jgi:hypothetical protein
MKTKYLILALLMIIGFEGCKKDNLTIIPDKVKPYTNEFGEKAKQRGVRLKWDGLSIILSGPLYNGKAAYYSTKHHTIYFDTTSSNWKCEMYRKITLYHELGHGLLNRDHRDDFMPNKFYQASMMNGQTMASLLWDDTGLPPYYWDELFNPSTPFPIWGY